MAQTPIERRQTLERVRSELTTGWQTADNSREKLTVADERELGEMYDRRAQLARGRLDRFPSPRELLDRSFE